MSIGIMMDFLVTGISVFINFADKAFDFLVEYFFKSGIIISLNLGPEE